MCRPLAYPWLVILFMVLTSACRERTPSGQAGTSTSTTRAPRDSTPVPGWAMDAARVLERQLQRERFNSKDTGYVTGARDCDEGAEEQPPPGLALVAASLTSNPVSAADEPNTVRIRTLLTSVARTSHHEGGDQEEVDVDVGVKSDTIDILVERQDRGFAICYGQLFLHRGHLDWPVVKKWTPPNGSWQMVTRLADSVDERRPPIK